MGREYAHVVPPKFPLYFTIERLNQSVSDCPLTLGTLQPYKNAWHDTSNSCANTLLESKSSRTIFHILAYTGSQLPRLSDLGYLHVLIPSSDNI